MWFECSANISSSKAAWLLWSDYSNALRCMLGICFLLHYDKYSQKETFNWQVVDMHLMVTWVYSMTLTFLLTNWSIGILTMYVIPASIWSNATTCRFTTRFMKSPRKKANRLIGKCPDPMLSVLGIPKISSFCFRRSPQKTQPGIFGSAVRIKGLKSDSL